MGKKLIPQFIRCFNDFHVTFDNAIVRGEVTERLKPLKTILREREHTYIPLLAFRCTLWTVSLHQSRTANYV